MIEDNFILYYTRLFKGKKINLYFQKKRDSKAIYNTHDKSLAKRFNSIEAAKRYKEVNKLSGHLVSSIN